MNRAIAVLWGLTFVALAQAATTEPVPPPPAIAEPPFRLPLLDGESRTHAPPQGKLEPASQPDPRVLFDMTVDCYPARSWFRGEIALEGRVGQRKSNTQGSATTTTAFDQAAGAITQTTGGQDNYVGVVARIPLFSAVELDKERERETQRRKTIADAVGILAQSLADKELAMRKLAPFRALEKRAQERVAAGVAATDEQVQYLKAVAELEGRLNEARAKVVEARMTFVGLCAEGVPADRVDAYIRQFTRGIE
ncbi:MAG: hypothetical protein IPG33_11080 [Betaproteobacteria bacterium]|nr:hypothetical protein [Betaproteobacteria bacterium]